MSRNEQILQLDPPLELKFKGPFLDVVTSELRLRNPSERRVCFKVKTTAPKRYCVRPNSGLIDPKSTVSVQVMLQPFDYDPNEKNKHKFMVQSMFAPEGPIDSQENLWKDVPPGDLMDSKLKCVFEMPSEVAQPQNNLGGGGKVDAEVTSPPLKQEPVSPPPASHPTKTPAAGTDELREALEDCRRLRHEVTQLRSENNTLRDEGVRLRRVMQSDTVSAPPDVHGATALQAQPVAVPPIVYLIAAIVFGLIIGKWIL